MSCNAHHPATPLFSSLVLLGQVRTGDSALLPDPAALTRFLAQYGRWFHDYVVATRQLHLVYARSLTIAAPGLLRVPDVLCELSQAAHSIGLATEVSLDAAECLAHSRALDQVLAHPHGIDALFLQIEPGLEVRQHEWLRALVSHCLASRASLHLSVSPSVLRALGTLGSREFSSRYVTVLAAPAHPGRPVRVPGLSSMPCRDHLRLYLDAEGDVYPCAGLVGVAAARLGNLHRPDLSSWFDASPLDFARLAQAGPVLGDAMNDVPFDLCEAHRRRLTSQEVDA
jgi:hypothetical protein